MSLFELIDNTRTDKNTTHCYLELYQKLFEPKKYTAKNVLEVGIGPPPDLGGSIRLWYDFFPNADIYAIDILPITSIWPDTVNAKDENHKVVLYTETNGYDETWFNETLLKSQIKFDMVIDDGPHTLESQVQFIKLYSQLLTEDGILVIEDVQDIRWVDTFRQVVPEHLKPFVEVHDLRHIKGRYDDIVFVINKSKSVA